MPDFLQGFQRITSNPANVQRDIFSTMLSRGADLSDYPETYFAAKRENFDPAGVWRGAADAETDSAATDSVMQAKQDLAEIGKSLNPAPGLWGKAKANLNQFLNNMPDPLAFRTPVVTAGQGIESGDVINQRALDFVRNFKPQVEDIGMAGSSSTYVSPFGTATQIQKMPRETGKGFIHDIAFTGESGSYDSASEIRRQIKAFEPMGATEVVADLRQQLEQMKDPLRSPAERYTLGTVLEDIPTGDIASAWPLNGQKGGRNRLYSSLSNQALASGKSGIESVRTGPNTWQNALGNTVEFDPATLKDPMIRSIYNLPQTADVSDLRGNPLGLFQGTNVDFSRPVITTESPVYQFRQNVAPGALGGLVGGAALSAMSPDVAQSVSQGNYGQAATRTAQNMATGAAADTGVRLMGLGLRQAAPQIAARVNPLVGAAADVALPAAVGAGLFMQGQQGSPLNTLVNAASNTPFGLKVNPKTDVGRMAGHAISNEAQYAWNQLMKGRLPWMGR